MTFEKPNKGNPQQLVIDQHYHSAHSIAKFYNNNDKVQLKMLESSVILERNKRAKIFCAQRNWDERSERGYMTDIETAFHKEIDTIRVFSERNHQAISNYFFLWGIRYKYHLNRLPNVNLNMKGSVLSKLEDVMVNKNRTPDLVFLSRIGAVTNTH